MNLVRIAILNLILSAFVVGCGVVTHPFIWYMVRSVTRIVKQVRAVPNRQLWLQNTMVISSIITTNEIRNRCLRSLVSILVI